MRILLLLMLFVMQWYLLSLTAFIPFPFRPLGASATYMYSETSLVATEVLFHSSILLPLASNFASAATCDFYRQPFPTP